MRMQTDTSGRESDLEFNLLGQVEIRRGARAYGPTAPKLLQTLALLLTEAGKVVPSESLINELWGERPPASAQRTMQTYVYQLRKLLKDNNLVSTPERVLCTKAPGYLFAIDRSQVDEFHFTQLYDRGRAEMAERRFEQAARSLRSALALWSGPPLANVERGPLLSAYAVDLQERRRQAHSLRIQAEIEAGMHRELIGELRALTTANPLDEHLHAQLICVLDRSGRRGEALHAYHRLRAGLMKELGVEPSRELQQLNLDMLSNGSSRRAVRHTDGERNGTLPRPVPPDQVGPNDRVVRWPLDHEIR